jgi:anti-anti-sigma factor
MASPQPARLAPADGQRAEAPRDVEPREITPDGLLRIRSTHDACHWTLTLSGELDISNASTLDQEIRRVEPHAETLTIDLRGLAFIDSSGLLAILQLHHRRPAPGRLHLCKGTTQLRIFQLLGLEDVLPFEP